MARNIIHIQAWFAEIILYIANGIVYGFCILVVLLMLYKVRNCFIDRPEFIQHEIEAASLKHGLQLCHG